MTDRMTEDRAVPDETLMALADGELDAAEEARLRAAMSREPMLAERFAAFAETRALLDASPARADEDPDGLARLTAALRAAGGAAEPARQPRAVRRFGVVEGGASAPAAAAPVNVAAARPATRWRVPIPALAASLALVVGGALGYGLAPRGDASGEAGGIEVVAHAPAAGKALAAALERSPSGTAAQWSDPASGLSGSVLPVASHRVADGRVCREYEIAVAGRPSKVVAVGCRQADGRWRTELATTAPAGDASYGTATGETAAERALADLGGEGAMSSEDEAAAIGKGWTAGPAGKAP